MQSLSGEGHSASCTIQLGCVSGQNRTKLQQTITNILMSYTGPVPTIHTLNSVQHGLPTRHLAGRVLLWLASYPGCLGLGTSLYWGDTGIFALTVMVSNCQLSVLLPEGECVIKRQLYSGPFTLREAASLIIRTDGKDSM